MKRVAVFASGRGSNLAALIAAQTTFESYRIVFVASNVAMCGALDLARDSQIESLAIPSKGLAREEHEILILDALKQRSIDCLCLAGYMRVLGSSFIEAFAQPILNIHPSLLPAFPGLHAQRQAVAAGAQWSGATVHFVDAGLDSGPIVLQAPVRVEDQDTETTLAARILEQEHALYPRALDAICRGDYEVRGRRVILGSADRP